MLKNEKFYFFMYDFIANWNYHKDYHYYLDHEPTEVSSLSTPGA